MENRVPLEYAINMMWHKKAMKSITNEWIQRCIGLAKRQWRFLKCSAFLCMSLYLATSIHHARAPSFHDNVKYVCLLNGMVFF